MTLAAPETPAPGPLLQTKLYAPRRTRGLVDRPRLSQLVDLADLPPLLVVSAPAGFGKSTLLAQSLLGEPALPDQPTVAWLSLDARDSDPSTFWAYVIAALRVAAPGVGEAALTLLEAPGGSPIPAVLTALLNELGSRDDRLVLVLDDYHVLQSRDIHESMTFVLDHLPSQLHIVIATRSDPGLPLARLRARGELREVRAADLRFTEAETSAYFDRLGLTLTAGDVATLEGRTEGWIAALQLAALSLQDRDDVAGFIAGFAGNDRHVVDYLIEEVVQRQPPDVHDFLLRTSILGRLSGPLCDAVTGRTDGKSMLDALDRGNLFLVPLDDQRRWYRYHHLFADMLQARLLDERPDQAPDLHRRAGAWHEQNGDTPVAIEHALAAGDADHAATLVELAMPMMTRHRQESQLRRWLEMLPEELFADRPVLAITHVGALMSTGETRGVETRLRAAQRWVEATRQAPPGALPAGVVVADPAEFHRLPGWIQVYRAGLCLMAGDVMATRSHGEKALALLDDGDNLGRGAATALMGLASWRDGELAAAEAAYAESMRRLGLEGYIADVLGCAITLADLQAAQGRLHDAQRTFEQALDLAGREPGAPLRGTPDMHVGLSVLHRERDDLEAATEHLVVAQALGEHLGLPQNPHRSRIATARLREAEGDLAGALELLDQAERVYNGDFSPDVRPVAAIRARVWVAQGRPDLALDWADRRGLSVADELDYQHEFEHVTLARALLAASATPSQRASLTAATELLSGLLRAAEEGGRRGSMLEILVLQALAAQAAGEVDAAMVSLTRALELGEPEEYVRTFTDEGPDMTTLLSTAARRGLSPVYVARLLRSEERVIRPTPPTPPTQTSSGSPPLVDRLSERELDVLRLLRTELTGPEIARQLVVSLNTVRTHTKNIYAKLGVGSRLAAIRRAEELGLLGRGPRA